MLSRKALLALVGLAVAVVAFVSLSGTTAAQPRPAVRFENVQVFSYTSGVTGFFDRETGTLYVYDKTWNKCVEIRRVNQLGAPMVDLLNPRR